MMTDEDIIDDIIAAMVGEYDTTSVLVSFLIRLLATKKPIYSNIVQVLCMFKPQFLNIQQENSKGKSLEEALTWEDLTKMNYTWRVASELLRMYPLVPITFRVVPKGWQVMLSALTRRDRGIFQTQPTIFDPSRFEKHVKSPPPFSYIPFGGGSKICPGIEFSKMETLAMIHRLMTQFTWELVKKDEPFKRSPMHEFDHGLLVRITPIKEIFASSKA